MGYLRDDEVPPMAELTSHLKIPDQETYTIFGLASSARDKSLHTSIYEFCLEARLWSAPPFVVLSVSNQWQPPLSSFLGSFWNVQPLDNPLQAE